MNNPAGCSATSKRTMVSPMLYRLPRAPCISGSERNASRCRNDTWLESMPPSSACSQLLYCSRFEVNVCAGGTQANSNSGRPGW